MESNRLSGHEPIPDELAAIEARQRNCRTYNFGMRDANSLAHQDVPYLLALVREQQARLERVEAIASGMDRVADKETSRVWPSMAVSLRAHAEKLRAALTATEETK